MATNTTNNKRPYIRLWISDISDWIGKAILYSADVKTTKSLKLCIYEHDGSNYTSTVTTIPENSEGNFKVTRTISSTCVALWIGIEFLVAQNQGEYFYTDNWQLYIQDD